MLNYGPVPPPSSELLRGPDGPEDHVPAPLEKLRFAEARLDQRINALDLFRDEVETAPRLERRPAALDEALGDRQLRVVRGIGQDDVERAALQLHKRRRGD